MTLERFNNGIKTIKAFLDDVYRNKNFSIAPTTTDNFEKLVAETEANGYITVTLEGCENTIYKTDDCSGVFYNILARVWHDTWHLNSHLNFSVSDEKIVCELQIQEFKDWYYFSQNASSFAGGDIVEDCVKIIEADIVGQLEYYDKFKQFVPHQKSYIMGYLGVQQ